MQQRKFRGYIHISCIVDNSSAEGMNKHTDYKRFHYKDDTSCIPPNHVLLCYGMYFP